MNTYAGDFQPYGGKIVVGVDNALAYGSGKGNVWFRAWSSMATIDLNGCTVTINGLYHQGATYDSSSGFDNSAAGTATLVLGANNANGNSFAGVIKNTGGALSVTKIGTGVQTLSGTHSYTGATTVNAGTLVFSGSMTGASSLVANYGGTLRADLSVNPTGVFNTASPVTLGGGTLNITGKNSGASSQTLGNLTLSANSVSTISITPNGGAGTTLTLGNTWTRNVASTLLIDLSATGTSTLTSSPAMTNGIIGGHAFVKDATSTGFASVSGGNVVRFTSATSLSANLATDTASTVNYKVTGTVSLDGPSATQTVNSLEIAAGGALNPSSAKTLLISSGGLLFTNTAWTYGGSNLTIKSGTSELQLYITTSDVNLYGTVAEDSVSTSLIKSGAGKLLMNAGVFSYTGDTIINQGSIEGFQKVPSGPGKGNLVVNPGGTANLGISASGGTVTINGLSGTTAGGIVNNSYGGLASNTFLNLGNNNATATFAGSIQGNIAIIKSGNGTQTLTGSNTYAGTTTINSGTLQIGNSGTTGSLSTSSTITNNGTLVFNRSDAVTQGTHFSSDAISGSGALIKAGAGTLTISAANTYSGATTISAGRLALGAAGSFANSSVVTIGNAGSSGAVLDLTAKTSGFTFGSGQTVKGIGTIQMASGKALTINGTLAAGNSPGTLTISDGDLVLGGSSVTSYEISGTNNTVGSGINDLTTVSGSLTLGGTLDVVATPSFDVFGSRTYRVFNYATSGTGSLAGSMAIGTSPDANYLYSLNTATAGQVNLFVQRRADQASTFTLTPNATRALVNSSVTVSGSVLNSSPAGGATLVLGLASTGLSGSGFTTGSVSPLGSVAVSGTLNAGSTVGPQAWSITNTDSSAITTVSTATGSITVVNQRAFSLSSGTISLGSFLRTASMSGSTSVTSYGSYATTASGTLGNFVPSSTNGFTLTTGDSTAFNGAASQTASYSLGGSASSAGVINGSFQSSVSAELGSIGPVSVALVGTAYDAASISKGSGQNGTIGDGDTISISNAAGTYRSAAYVASTSLTGQGWSVTGFGTGSSAAAGATLAGTAHFDGTGLLSGTYAGTFSAMFQNNQSYTGAGAGDLGSLSWSFYETHVNTSGTGSTSLSADTALSAVSLTSSAGAGATIASFAAGTTGPSGADVTMSFSSGGSGLYSDVLNLHGTNGLDQVLQLTYDASLLGSVSEDSLVLAWFDQSTSEWVNSVLGNTGNVLNWTAGYAGSWSDYVASTGGLATAANSLGAFGVDTANKTVWAAINHNSQFAVTATVIVPEPGTIIFAGIGIAMAGWSLRKRRRIG